MVVWARTRSFFPVTRHFAYLNNASVAPISTRVEEALQRYAGEASARGGFDYATFFEGEIERVRRRAAILLGATRDELAFVRNTTHGIGLVAAGLDWRRGDAVATCDLEHPSNVLPWQQLGARGVETLLIPSEGGRLPLDRIEDALRIPRVRVLALSSVAFGSGARHDLAAIGRLCRDHGVLFCVDAIQSLGCLELDVGRCNIDFLAAGGQKWLCSVEGCGLFYCSRRMLDTLAPPLIGWHNVADDTDYDRYQTDLRADAGRFEEATPNTPGIFALGAAIDLILELGIGEIERRVLTLSEGLAEALRERGAEVLSPRGKEASGIVAFRLDEDPARTVQRLRDRRVHVTLRRGAVRASPHFYNAEEDLDALIEAL